MASKIGQIRIPGYTSLSFNSEGWSQNLLGSAGPINKLGIYAVPGTVFKIKQEQQNFDEPTLLTIGGTGLFSIDLDKHYISELYLSEASYKMLTEPANHFIVIDYIYVEQEAEI